VITVKASNFEHHGNSGPSGKIAVYGITGSIFAIFTVTILLGKRIPELQKV
jgi:hypothetical protein